MRNPEKTNAAAGRLIIIAAAALALILFTYLTPPIREIGFFRSLPFVGKLGGDLPLYFGRFGLSFLLFGLFPMTVILLLGYKPTAMGLRMPAGKYPLRLIVPVMLAAVAVGAAGAFDKALAAYYPYSSDIAMLAGGNRPAACIIHGLLYLFFYYLPWEFFFRGFLIFPFTETDSRSAVWIAAFQAIPSALLHFGHPFAETLGAVPFGIAAGIIAFRTRSILFPLLFHFLTGLSLDITLVIRG